MTIPFSYTPEQEAWLHDLEKTKTKQAKGMLHYRDGRANSYCCLGRACVVLKATREIYDRGVAYDGERLALPISIENQLHLYSSDGNPKIEGKNLAEMNDAGIPFKEIARIIRADPWNWFKQDANGEP